MIPLLNRPLYAVLLRAASIILISSVLTGCGALVVGGATTTGVVASDRRSTGDFIDDQTIALTVSNRVSDKHAENAHVNANSYRGHVLITGEAASEIIQQDITQIAQNVKQVTQVTNEVRVAPNSSLANRSNDSYLSTRVNAAIIGNKDLTWGSFVIVVENKVVYLRGTVTEREGAIAAKVAAGIPGVKRVVKLFEYVSQEAIEQMREDERTIRTVPPSSEDIKN